MEENGKADIFITNERMGIEHITIGRISLAPDREKLETELRTLYSRAFPKMSEYLRELIVSNYFMQPIEQLHRQVFLIRNESGRLIAASRFDCGNIEYHDSIMKGVYFITYAVLPEYQNSGLGKIMAAKVLTDFRPDILLVTCMQSSALHSWVGLRENGVSSGYEIFPRLEQDQDKEILITIPYEKLDFIMNAFEQMFMGVLRSQNKSFEYVIRNLTIFMARKNISEESYDFDPWKKYGREDRLANALGLTDKDGVLVVFVKNTILSGCLK